ncbi:MAG: hypothetical protein HC802_01730 [Caldilineaceae bacterium]|nr:hypothetical protein [Caldilineaceae bacterium]
MTSFEHVGFKVFARQTIWRLPAHRADNHDQTYSATIRPATKQDEWGIQRLYANVVPPNVQQAEGATNGHKANEQTVAPPLSCYGPSGCAAFVLEEKQDVAGYFQIARGSIGCWLQLWTDTHDPDTARIHQMLRFALCHIQQHIPRRHIYIGVSDYQGGMGSVLDEYGFAPFTDRAKMVKHLLQWVREPSVLSVPILESVAGVVPSQFVEPSIEPRKLLHARTLGTDTQGSSSLAQHRVSVHHRPRRKETSVANLSTRKSGHPCLSSG